MSVSEQNYGTADILFTLTVDRFEHLWLHTKLEGIPVSIDLAAKDVAFEIMAAAMAEHGFEPPLTHAHEPAENDDEVARKI